MADTRAYTYNQADLQDLFARIIGWLSAPGGEEGSTGRILSEVCNHFRFGFGFVYEADHTGTFHLKERYAEYDAQNIQPALKLDEHLTAAEVDKLLGTQFYYVHLASGENSPKITRVFQSNTFLMVPVLHPDDRVAGLVGMMDRRRNILLDANAVQAAKTVLNLLANNVKLRTYQRNLEFTRQTLVNILDNTGVDIYVTDFRTNEILYVNQSMAAPYGGREAMLGKKCWKVLYEGKTGPCDYCPQRKLIDACGRPTKVYCWDYRRPFDGSWFRVVSAAFRWVDGRLAHAISSVDITENKRNEATIAHMANYDALTGLPNRRKLLRDCEDALNSVPSGARGYLLFFDLDDFKLLNDSVGHQAGDELLLRIGAELQEHPLTKNHIYRYGGDEFILLYHDTDRESITRVAAFLLERFDRPWVLTAVCPKCDISIGIAEYPADAATADDLLHRADKMMYKGKESGGGIACFSDGTTLRRGGRDGG